MGTTTITVEAGATPRVSAPAVEARGVAHRFGRADALRGVDLGVRAGDILALLGPNGAGKTTLLRSLMGLLVPDAGEIRMLGMDPGQRPLALRRRVAFIPSGDRSLYLRISGLENLRFYARLAGMPKKEAVARSLEVIESVGLTDAARRPVSGYSHGMQKRLSVARALLTRPEVLLVDEATHDLDPEAADQVRALIRAAADDGAAVVWTTQRIEEIRGLADGVVLLRRGEVCFTGPVPALMDHARLRGYLVRFEWDLGPDDVRRLQAALGDVAELVGATEGGAHHALRLADGAVLGTVLATLAAAGAPVTSCTEERSALEEAFRSLTGSADA